MSKLSLLSANDVQASLCEWLVVKRKTAKLSRDQLAKISTVPASTIKKFEVTQQISFRQFILLWQSLDELDRLNSLTQTQLFSKAPTSIDEVLG
ncbi:transcriptional regulator [Colwellia sp. 75C3]|uniref:transcriptional regulator n=1 Tax=Colwellia sp. 75C3 TaxID=888425 RepID=UPI000C32B979|nr:transcriptional regulator [Colwellia sp. 75C3]PKG83980.1 transcriptional regulator [Colwellia sp. 75C3]